MIDKLLEYNKTFVASDEYKKYASGKYPKEKVAILSCMDTRLLELIPAALGLKNGDVKMIKNAGGVISAPFGSVIRSLLIGIIELGVEEVMVIGHTDCGVSTISADILIKDLLERGISQESIDLIKSCGVDFEKWLAGFNTVEESVFDTVETIKNHPLIPNDIVVGGYVIDTITGEIKTVCEAEKVKQK